LFYACRSSGFNPALKENVIFPEIFSFGDIFFDKSYNFPGDQPAPDLFSAKVGLAAGCIIGEKHRQRGKS